MTDYADLEKRLRDRVSSMRGVDDYAVTRTPPTIDLLGCAADALTSITRELEEAKALVAFALDRLEDTDDAGPRDEGWQSAELMEWIAKARDLSRALPSQDETT